MICAPSGSTVSASIGSSPTNCLRSGLRFSLRAKERLPMKSTFFFDTTQFIPRSCGVMVPSVSWPMMG